MRTTCIVAAIALIALPATASAQDAAKVKAVLQANCYRCHGQEGAVEGGMNYILDLPKLVQRKKIVPGSAETSPIFKRIANGTMPPPDSTTRPSDADKLILKQWIDSGAGGITAPARTFVTDAQINDWVLADLDTIDRRSRRFTRYFTLTHLYNAGLSDDEIATYRNALSKVVNSLSWHPKVRNPEPVDPLKTIFRIDLRWYMWDAVLWNRVLVDYPYGVLDDTASSRAVAVATANRMPLIRGDWFTATACRPPLYNDILQMPSNLTELERTLRIDAGVNILQERVMRAAFTGSGIARNNRVLERHDSIHGYYWRTYDFEEVQQNLVERGQLLPDRKNVFAYPLGPGGLENNFTHAGGEAIFSLPNGLQAYIIVNANNLRIDKAPVQIVSDPKRPDRAVETGISCMSCHIPGIIPKADQVHDYALKNPKSYAKADADLVRVLYPPKEKTLAQMEEDGKKYQAAVALTGAKIGKSEPVTTVTLQYEGDLDLVGAATEVGMTPAAFKDAVAKSESLTRNLGALQVPGGTVNRQVWVQTFGDLVRDLKLGTLFSGSQVVSATQDNTGDIDPLESRGSQANQFAFSADGRTALIAGADRTVRTYEVEGRRDLKRFIGHLGSVWAVAFSPDGKRALSAGMDQTVRLWEIDGNGGRPVHILEGHDALVTAVAFSPDGKFAASGGFDGQIIVWDLEKGTLVKTLGRKMRYVHALAWSKAGDKLFAAGDKSVWVWDMPAASGARELVGHVDSVTCLAVSDDDTKLVAGCDDGTFKLWDLKTNEVIRTFTGHDGPVKSVAMLAKPDWLLSGGADGTVRLWQTATGKELGAFRKHTVPVVSVSFASSGRQTLSGDQNGGVLVWDLARFLPKAIQKEPEPKYEPVQVPKPTPIPTPKPEPLPMPVVKVVAPSGELSAALTLPLGGTSGGMVTSANGKWLFVLDLGTNKVLRVDTTTMKVTQEYASTPTLEVMAITPDGKTLYVASTSPKDGGALVALDSTTLKEQSNTPLRSAPFDLAATDDGTVFVSGTLDGRPVVQSVSVKGDKPILTWGVSGNVFVRGAADQSRLLVCSSEGAGRVESWAIGKDGKRSPKLVGLLGTPDAPLTGEPVVLPGGKAMAFPSGAIVKLNPGQDDDLTVSRTIEPFVSLSADAGAGIFALSATGDVKIYTPGSWAEKVTHRVKGTPYQVLYHAATGRMYLAVLDPSSLNARPRVRGFGQVWAVDLKPELAAK